MQAKDDKIEKLWCDVRFLESKNKELSSKMKGVENQVAWWEDKNKVEEEKLAEKERKIKNRTLEERFGLRKESGGELSRRLITKQRSSHKSGPQKK